MVRRALWIVLLAAISVPASGAEGPPPNLAEMLKEADRGEPLGPEQLLAIERFAKDHLFRVRCNTLEDARFSLAQLQMKAGRGEEAIQTLTKLMEVTKSPDVKSVALYDIGKVYHVSLNDTKSAAEAFEKVTGRFQPMAWRTLLRMYERAGQPGKAIAFLQAAAAKSKEKGEKLALLRQLAEFCRRAGRAEAAIGAYRQITQEFTDKDIEAMKAAAANRVKEAFKKYRALQATGDWREVDKIMSQTKTWIGQLVAAGRTDEFRAAQEELRLGWRKMEEGERKRDEARKKERRDEKGNKDGD